MSTADKIASLLLTNEPTDCFATPGADFIVDMVHPDTGLSCIYGRSLEDIRREYPNAIRMPLAAHSAAKAERQRVPFTWEPTTREKYDEMLECLPPACHRATGFLVGEPWDHDALSGQPRFQAFRVVPGMLPRYVVASRPLTRQEFLDALRG